MLFRSNVGDRAMEGTTTYEVYYAASGNPRNGSVVATGSFGPLAKDACTELTYNPNGQVGNYMFHVFQRPGHPGQGDLWSEQCSIASCVTATTPPTHTPTPSTPDPRVGLSVACNNDLSATFTIRNVGGPLYNGTYTVSEPGQPVQTYPLELDTNESISFVEIGRAHV